MSEPTAVLPSALVVTARRAVNNSGTRQNGVYVWVYTATDANASATCRSLRKTERREFD
jgi:hypothetical protein